MKMVRCKVAGVSFANDDGSSRQRIIRKYCRIGKSLEVRLEPDERYSEDAMGLWVRGRWLLIFPARYQIGHIKNEIATQIRADVIRGSPISVRILDVTGGGWFRKELYGVNIEIRVGVGDEFDSQVLPQPNPAPNVKQKPPAVKSPSRPRSPVWSPLKSVTVRCSLASARTLFRVVSDLATRFVALSRAQKVIAAGTLACCVGLALWAIGYSADRSLGFFSLLRPAGAVAVIVGSGVICLGTVFYLTESTGKPTG